MAFVHDFLKKQQKKELHKNQKMIDVFFNYVFKAIFVTDKWQYWK